MLPALDVGNVGAAVQRTGTIAGEDVALVSLKRGQSSLGCRTKGFRVEDFRNQAQPPHFELTMSVN